MNRITQEEKAITLLIGCVCNLKKIKVWPVELEKRRAICLLLVEDFLKQMRATYPEAELSRHERSLLYHGKKGKTDEHDAGGK